MDLGKKIKKLKSEGRKALNAYNAANVDNNQSLINKNEELIILVQKKEQTLNIKEEEVETINNKLRFIKPKLESSLKENQILHARVTALEQEKTRCPGG